MRTRKRRLSQAPSARLMRRSVAYSRLAAKAGRAGNLLLSDKYAIRAGKLHDQADRARAREALRK